MLQITRTADGQIALPPLLRKALWLVSAIDVVIGLLFVFGPELDVTIWPSPIAPILMRFIGGIVVGSGLGAGLAAQQGTWEGARVIFTIALTYGYVAFFGTLYHLIKGDVKDSFWGYMIVVGLFSLPITYIYYTFEKAYRSG